MTLLFTEAFEYTGSSTAGPTAGKWNTSDLGSGYTTTTTNARTGRCTTAGFPAANLKRKVPAAEEHATMICGIALRQTSYTSVASPHLACPLVFFSDSGATLHVAILCSSTTGVVSAIRGNYDVASGGTLLGASAAGVMPSSSGGAWKYLEAKVTLHDTTGAVQVKVDGTSVLNLTNVDTKNAGTKTTFDTLSFGALQASGNGQIDDVYCCNGAGSTNNDFLGPVKVEMLMPNGNGNSSGLTNSAGTSTNNSTYVDDVAPNPDTTDYVQGIASLKDTYTFADSTQTPTNLSVKGVCVHAYAVRVDATAGRFDTVARLSGTEATATPVTALNSLAATGLYVWGVHETKPGGGAWTVADVNSAEFGIQAV